MIKIDNLIKKFDDKIIFAIDELIIEDGKITVLYGESGSGKTTLLNIIGCLDRYDSGTISIDDMIIPKALSEKAIKLYENTISYISQTPILISDETVKDNMKFSKATNDEKLEILNLLNIEELYEKKISSLSGGEQQRVSIAIAILKEAKIILADEPTGNLDQKNTEIIYNIFNELSKKGITVLIVSHDDYIINQADEAINLLNYKIS